MKRTKISGVVMAGALGLAGVGVGVAIAPGAASAAVSAPASRLTSIKDALSGLVKDGTITQAQADKVASTLNDKLPQGRGGHGAQLETAAGVIGISVDDLRTALEGGKTLAQVAATKNISQATLVSKLVAAEKTRLAAEVKAGHLTQAEADKRSADLQTRITQEVTSTRPEGGRGHGGGGRGGYGGGGTSTPTPSASASASS